jgi:type IV pilus assembly protein PilB
VPKLFGRGGDQPPPPPPQPRRDGWDEWITEKKENRVDTQRTADEFSELPQRERVSTVPSTSSTPPPPPPPAPAPLARNANPAQPETPPRPLRANRVEDERDSDHPSRPRPLRPDRPLRADQPTPPNGHSASSVEPPPRQSPPPEDKVPPIEGRHPSGILLGDLLVEQGLITQTQLLQALEEQKKSGQRLGEVVVRLGMIDERKLTSVLAEQFGVGVGDMAHQAPSPQVTGKFSEKLARELNALPLRDVDGVVEVIVGDLRPGLEVRLREALGAPVQMLAVPPSIVRQAIDRTYRALSDVDHLVKAYTAVDVGQKAGPTIATEEKIAADSPVAKVVTTIVTEALRDRASDVHLEPSDEQLRVRFRIDGALHDVLNLPMAMAAPLVSRVKILAGMNIVERRKAQDGQFTTEVDGRGIDVRVSTMATVFGEKCVMRILDKSRSLYRLGQLGMPVDTQVNYDKLVRSPFGMVLCAGPTGSGKTTTLYATLNEIDERSRNVVTIEDPVEYVFPSINQIQTNDQAGITFADGLKAILRQDPDVILVGEIRDQETARIATQAALTGHFVLSSLHATDSVAALHRFLDMGIEAFLVASSILGVVSQRLVRRICQSCAAPYEPTTEELAFYRDGGGPDKSEFIKGLGCEICTHTGYQDRIGVYEFLKITPEIRRLLVGWATQDELRRVAIQQGMRTLRTEGLELVSQNVTTIAEVIRSIYAL